VDVVAKFIAMAGVMIVLTFVLTFLFVEPLLALVLLGVISTMMILAFDPATGKAMAQLVIPVTLVLFFFELMFLQFLSFQWWELVIVAGVLYLMFFLFAGGAGHDGGAFVYSKVSLKFAPLYGAILVLAILTDPTGRLSILIMVGSVLGLMGLYSAFLRSYDKWPAYRVLQPRYGLVLDSLSPKGKVKLGQEVWWAESISGNIPVGAKVEIESVDGLTLKVKNPEKASKQKEDSEET
jgi:membrane-bound ClpP family serine protease